VIVVPEVVYVPLIEEDVDRYPGHPACFATMEHAQTPAVDLQLIES
jgi:hypothetical protein